MTLLQILTWPDSGLRVKATSVADFNPELKELVDSMAETMYFNKGIGLAATQVGIPLRILVMDITPYQSKLEVFINPILASDSENHYVKEGCLSFPGLFEFVLRPKKVSGSAQTVEGISFTFSYEGLAAQCIEHETNHLDGIVMLDKLDRAKRRFAEKQLLKFRGK